MLKLAFFDILENIIFLNFRIEEENLHLEITNKIQQLEIKDIKDNLFHYSYDNKNLKELVKNHISKDDISYMTAYSSFIGEIYENIIYELLLEYVLTKDEITKFVLKGPYQAKENQFIKSGLLIDSSSQIVYKSAYKDISEFDALFFTKDSVYFVEMSTSKKTSSLNKRLVKKCALLKMIFPFLEVKALIVVTVGSVGLKSFPPYATIWTTKDLDDEYLIEKIIFAKKVKNDIQTLEVTKNEKYVEAYKIEYKKFPYFPTLEWILNTSRKNPKFAVDLKFFSTPKMSLYFDIYTKLYIGYLSGEDFKILYEDFDMNVRTNRVFVTLEKINKTDMDIVYYVKQTNDKLKRVRLQNGDISIRDKELDGFTNAEVKFFMKVFEPRHQLSIDNIKHILKHIVLIK